MEIYPCGTMVKTKVAGIEGMISSVKIEFTAVIYCMQYFSDGCFKTWEMSEPEFDVTDANKKQSIGFKSITNL